MKKIFFILFAIGVFSNISNAAASDRVVIELGEDYILKGSTSKIWIENAKILSAVSTAAGVSLKTNSIGETRIRQNNKLIKVSIVPLGSQKTFQDWQKLSQKFLNVSVAFCEDVVCLKGKLFRFEDFKKIIELIQRNDSSIYLALEANDELKAQLNLWYENRFRESGLTPFRIQYNLPWKLSYSTKESGADYRTIANKWGILATENKQKIEIADNIHVEVKMAEVKKDFGQTLGLKWPDQYDAQILGGVPTLPNSIGAVLNSQENQGNIKILATPNLVCRSGKEAEFFAGGEFPIKLISHKNHDVVWKKYGIIMKVKPVIDSIGQMSIQIESEISSIDPSRSVDGIPALLTNRVSSFFDLIESKTIALSGLIRNETSQNSDGLPFLSRLPILGLLFSSKQFKENNSELVIFVTPKLMRNE